MRQNIALLCTYLLTLSNSSTSSRNIVLWYKSQLPSILCFVSYFNKQSYYNYLCSYLPTYAHTYLHMLIPTYVCAYLPTYAHTYLRMFVPTYLCAYLPTYLHTYLPIRIPTYRHWVNYARFLTCYFSLSSATFSLSLSLSLSLSFQLKSRVSFFSHKHLISLTNVGFSLSLSFYLSQTLSVRANWSKICSSLAAAI